MASRCSPAVSTASGSAAAAIADRDVGHAFADRVHDARHVEADAARELARVQALAERPVCRVESTGVHGHADAVRGDAGQWRLFELQDLGGLAIGVEAEGSHRHESILLLIDWTPHACQSPFHAAEYNRC